MKKQFKISFLVLLIHLTLGCHQIFAEDKDVRQPAVAGQFYPDNPNELSSFIEKTLSKVPNRPDVADKTQPITILVPHAGYVYSAQTAAYAFKLLENSNINTVILIGNSHNFPLNRGAIDLDKSFSTPLGNVPVNRDLAKEIINKTPLLQENNYVHNPEHSLEVELPFLQKVLKDFSIVPILLGPLDLEECRQIGEAIASVLKEKNIIKQSIIVISSDMSHYPSLADAKLVDNETLKSVEKLDPEILDKTITSLENSKTPNLQCVMCGKESVFTGMFAAKALGADKAVALNYTNSGNVSGDKSRVVGYGAVVLTRPLNKPVSKETNIKPAKEKKMEEFSISEKNQKVLLQLARSSIETYLKTEKRIRTDLNDPELQNPAAVFVTLTVKNHQLRGCIGTTVPQLPLYKAVAEYALAAAFEDPRFNRVGANELKDIKIEISVLSPMEKISDPDKIQQNVHGVMVKKGFRSGLFLPQVWEHFSSKEDFMNELCSQKAGLAPDTWKKGDCDLYTFTVFPFEEN